MNVGCIRRSISGKNLYNVYMWNGCESYLHRALPKSYCTWITIQCQTRYPTSGQQTIWFNEHCEKADYFINGHLCFFYGIHVANRSRIRTCAVKLCLTKSVAYVSNEMYGNVSVMTRKCRFEIELIWWNFAKTCKKKRVRNLPPDRITCHDMRNPKEKQETSKVYHP